MTDSQRRNLRAKGADQGGLAPSLPTGRGERREKAALPPPISLGNSSQNPVGAFTQHPSFS